MDAHKDHLYRTNREGEYKITMFIVFQRQFLRWMNQRADSVKLESKLLKRNIDMKRYSEFIVLIEKFKKYKSKVKRYGQQSKNK